MADASSANDATIGILGILYFALVVLAVFRAIQAPGRTWGRILSAIIFGPLYLVQENAGVYDYPDDKAVQLKQFQQRR